MREGLGFEVSAAALGVFFCGSSGGEGLSAVSRRSAFEAAASEAGAMVAMVSFGVGLTTCVVVVESGF